MFFKAENSSCRAFFHADKNNVKPKCNVDFKNALSGIMANMADYKSCLGGIQLKDWAIAFETSNSKVLKRFERVAYF